jgi:hypothetical protein
MHTNAYGNAYKIWLENLKERDQMEDPGINGWAVLKQILKKHKGNGFIWLRTGTSNNDLWVPLAT